MSSNTRLRTFCTTLFLALSFTTGAEQRWPDPEFAVVYENFAWSLIRRGILIDDAGVVYSFKLNNTNPNWSLCNPYMLRGYQRTRAFFDHGKLWKERIEAPELSRMVEQATKAIAHDVKPPGPSSAADTGIGCYLYLTDVPGASMKIRHLLAVEGDLMMSPGSAYGTTVVDWLRKIISRIDWSEEAVPKKQDIGY